jgi:hypothetical protein
MRWSLVVLLVACHSSVPGTAPPVAGDPDSSTPDAGRAIWAPHPGTSWQWQLEDGVDTSFDVAMYDVDMFDTPRSTIDALHAAGRIVICYVDVGSYEPGRPDSSRFPASVRGNELDGWPGEYWLDTRSPVVRQLVTARLDIAVAAHCDGVEPDNVDGYQNDPGFALTAATQLDYNRFVASAAHARGLSVGLKNDSDQLADLLPSFDWMLDEQCFQYGECDALAPFVAADKAVFEVEYGAASLATTICPQANADNFDTLIKPADMSVTASRVACR